MFVDINRNDISRPETIRIVEAAVDGIYLRLYCGLFSRARYFADVERTRVNERPLIALLRNGARPAIFESRRHCLRLLLRRERDLDCADIDQYN